MKGDAKVMVALQAAIALEGTLAAMYCINSIDQKRLGLHTGGELHEFASQCKEYRQDMVRRLFFLEGDPELSMEPAKAPDTIKAALEALLAKELAAISQYQAAVKLCWEAGDMSNFHWFQHMTKWHEIGDDKYKGHVAYLQKEIWQMEQLGEADYVAVHLGPKA